MKGYNPTPIMIDHFAISNPEYTTAILTWMDGGLHFFKAPKIDGGLIVLDAYYLAYGIGIYVAYLIARREQRRGNFHVKSYQVYDMTLVSIVGILLGAKLGYVLFYHLNYYIERPMQIVTNWSGMASHGAIVGLLLGYWLWTRKIGVPWLHVVDNAVIGGAYGAVFIRSANFLNGELYGRSCSPDLPWGMRFFMRDDVGQTLWADAKNNVYSLVVDLQGSGPTEHLEPYTLNEGFARFEGFSHLKDAATTHVHVLGSKTPIEVWRVVTDARHPSQIYQLLIEGLILGTLLVLIRRRTRRVGTLTGAFFVGYGVARVIGEFFRQPDSQVGYLLGDASFGLTMGQALSLGLIAAGCAILAYRAKRPRLIADLSPSAQPVNDASPR